GFPCQFWCQFWLHFLSFFFTTTAMPIDIKQIAITLFFTPDYYWQYLIAIISVLLSLSLAYVLKRVVLAAVEAELGKKIGTRKRLLDYAKRLLLPLLVFLWFAMTSAVS